jgi:small subunit ribosomal protein S19e
MTASKQVVIKALAKELKQSLHKPEWAEFVKTGHFKQKPPVDNDWWFMRAGSILMKVDALGPVGVSKLKTKYGGRKNRGVAPDKTARASGKILRVLLQQLEKEGLLKQEVRSGHKGRVTTPKAKSLIIKLQRAHAKEGGAQ